MLALHKRILTLTSRATNQGNITKYYGQLPEGYMCCATHSRWSTIVSFSTNEIGNFLPNFLTHLKLFVTVMMSNTYNIIRLWCDVTHLSRPVPMWSLSHQAWRFDRFRRRRDDVAATTKCSSSIYSYRKEEATSQVEHIQEIKQTQQISRALRCGCSTPGSKELRCEPRLEIAQSSL